MSYKDEEYVEYILSCKQEAEDARKPLERTWDELWLLYQNKQDWTKKADWQSKAFVPKIFTQIFKSAGEVKRAIMQIQKLFKLEYKDGDYLERLNNLEEMKFGTDDPNEIGLLEQEIQKTHQDMSLKLSKMLMREKTFQKDLANSNFAQIYSEMLESAFLLGIGVIKVFWTDNGVKYEHVDAKNFYISPDYQPSQDERPKYVIEYKEMDLAKLKNIAKDRTSPYINSVVKKIEEDLSQTDEESDRLQRMGMGYYSKPTKKVVLLEYWGDIIHKDGKIEENQLITVANDKYIIRKHENKFGHNKPPYIITLPIVYPHRGICGVSMVQPMAKLQYLYNNIVNMIADNLNYSVNKVFEYNPSDLKNPRGLTVIYPGKTIATNSSQQAIREVVTTPVGGDALRFLATIDRDMQESTSITKSITGVSDTTRKTKSQHEDELSQAKGTFDIIGRDLENNSIKPLLEMTYDLYSQFMDYESRIENYSFMVGGVSAIISQRELIDHMREVMQFAVSIPPLTQMTNMSSLWKRFLSLYNLQDVYQSQNEGQMPLRPEQTQGIQMKAEQDAKQAVSQMSPEEIMKRAM